MHNTFLNYLFAYSLILKINENIAKKLKQSQLN